MAEELQADGLVVFALINMLLTIDRSALLSMWNNFRQNLHFVDCYLLALAGTNKYKIITFDKELNKKSEANN